MFEQVSETDRTKQLMHEYYSYSSPSLYDVIILYMYNNMWTKYFASEIFVNWNN